MPRVVAETYVPVSPARAFAVSQTTGEVRLRWDPFIRSQHFEGGATAPAKGVRTLTRSRIGPRMVSEYVSYRPPTSVGMTMVTGPWFFASFGGGWRFEPEGDGCRATWKYTYTIRPRWLRFAAEPVGQLVLGRQIRARIAGFARGCADPMVLAATDQAVANEPEIRPPATQPDSRRAPRPGC